MAYPHRSARVYVGNLPRDARLFEVEDRFNRYGESRRARRAPPRSAALAAPPVHSTPTRTRACVRER
jgi:hypothetical protein